MSFFDRFSIKAKGVINANQFTNNKNKPKSQVFRDNFTTARVRISTSQRLGGLSYIEAVIDNQDPTNSLTVRTEPDAPAITVPPNSVLIIENEIHDFIDILPNAVTGVGNFSLQTANPDDLRASGFLGL